MIANAAPVAVLAWFLLREPSWTAVAIGVVLGVVAAVAHVAGYVLGELQADGYAVRVAGIDHDTADEVWDYLAYRFAATTSMDRLRRRYLHILADRSDVRL